MQNKEFKRELIENGVYKHMREDKSNLYKELYEDYKENYKVLNEVIFENLKENYTDEELKAFNQLTMAQKQQAKRLKEHIRFLAMLKEYRVYFVTFTFNDEFFNTHNATSRKRAILELLRVKGIEDYIINIDYGLEHEREHYHVVIALNRYYEEYCKKEIFNYYKFTKWDELNIDKKIGYYSMKKVYFEQLDEVEREEHIQRLGKYMTKLVLHSIKVHQQYISVKKGSKFQRYKKLKDRYMQLARTKRARFTKKLEQEKESIYKEISNILGVYNDTDFKSCLGLETHNFLNDYL